MMERIGCTVGGRRALIGALLLGGMAVPRPAMAQASYEREVLHVLFAGNSQLFSNNLGDIVAGIAAADPLGPIIVPTMAGTGTLKGHLEGQARKLIEGDTEWNYVILQEVALLPGGIESPTLPIWPEPEREFVIGEALVGAIRQVLEQSDFLGEGHRKVRVRLRPKGICDECRPRGHHRLQARVATRP